jgi:hypothetical protein
MNTIEPKVIWLTSLPPQRVTEGEVEIGLDATAILVPSGADIKCHNFLWVAKQESVEEGECGLRRAADWPQGPTGC